MAGKSSVVRVAIVGDNSSLLRSLNSSQSKIAKFGKAIAKAGILVGAAAAVGLIKMTEAAIADEQAQAILADTIKKTTGAGDAQIAMVEDWITVQGQLLGVTDDELRPALGKLLAVTGDIGEAEDLASLAMDVSVGRHKDLSTVTEALAKARNGSLTGLAKLGVQTKNADGSTRSLAEITADLTQKYGGLAETAGNTTAGKFQRLRVRFSELGEEIGSKLLPVVNDLGGWLLDEGVPAIEDLAQAMEKKLGPAVQDLRDWLKENKDELADFGEQIIDTVIPAAEKLGGFIGDLVGWFNKLPGPVKDFAVQIGLAAVVVPKLSRALTGMNLTSLISNLGTAEGKMKLFGQTAKTAAGVGGVALLASSMDDAAGSSKLLKETLGGAGVGAMLGGPWGALIGGTFGALHGAYQIMFGDVEQAGTVMADGKADVVDYASSFDTLTGKVTGATRELILNAAESSGAAGQARLFGITNRELVNSVLGMPGALETVNSKLAAGTTLIVAYTDAWGGSHTMAVDNQKQADLLTASLEAEGNTIDSVKEKNLDLASQKGVLAFIGEQTNEWRQASAAKRQDILATQDLGNALKGLPDNVVTAIEATGIVPTVKGIARVANKYPSIDNKHLKSIIEVTGVETTVKGVRRVGDNLKNTGKIKPDLSRWSTGTNKFVSDLAPKVARSAENVGKAAKDGVKQGARGVDLNPFQRGVQNGITKAKGTASTGGTEVGTSLKTGFAGGFAGAIAAWSSQVRAAVAAAIAAGKSEAKAHSPSKETEKTGRDLAEGYVVGSKKGEPAVKKSGENLVKAWFQGAGAAGGLEAINAALDRATTYITNTLAKQLKEQQQAIKKRLDGKAEDAALKKLEKRWNEHGKAVTKALKDEYAALRKNGRLQDENQAKLEAATEAYTSYSNAIRDSIVEFGNITTLGRRDNGTVSLPMLLAQLRKRAADAQKFAALLQQLAALGLNAAQIAQLTAAGPEQALATAQAIASGGQAAVNEINALSTSLFTTGSTLGDALSNQFSIAGTNAAQALIAGLEAEQERLDKAAKQMARALAREVKKELGIKSPSTVFKKMGDQVTKGLVLGLDPVQAAEGGRVLAGATVTGATGTTTATRTDTQMRSVGQSAQVGLVEGIIADIEKVVASGTMLANALVEAVKKALGSKSPSKEFQDIGASVTEGLVLGLDEVYVSRAGASLADSLVKGYGQPQLSTGAVMGSGQGFTVGVTLSAQQVSQLERGRAVQLDLDAYRSAGGRSRS